MAITIDGPNKLFILTSGTTELDVKDLLSRWKDWVLLSDNSKYLPAFNSVGGDTIDVGAGTEIPAYCFLLNGWKVRPQEASHTLGVTVGILLVEGGGDPFVNTIGSFVVRVNYQQPVQAITITTAAQPSAQQIRDAMKLSPTAGAFSTNSIDTKLDNIKKDTKLIPAGL